MKISITQYMTKMNLKIFKIFICDTKTENMVEFDQSVSHVGTHKNKQDEYFKNHQGQIYLQSECLIKQRRQSFLLHFGCPFSARKNVFW